MSWSCKLGAQLGISILALILVIWELTVTVGALILLMSL
jgi:hypothetical protein